MYRRNSPTSVGLFYAQSGINQTNRCELITDRVYFAKGQLFFTFWRIISPLARDLKLPVSVNTGKSL
jgi:hypothetical protein